MAGLDLRTLPSLLQGSRNGPVVVEGAAVSGPKAAQASAVTGGAAVPASQVSYMQNPDPASAQAVPMHANPPTASAPDATSH